MTLQNVNKCLTLRLKSQWYLVVGSVRKIEENEEERIALLRHERMENGTCDDTDSIIIIIQGKKTLGDKVGLCRDKVDKKSKE
ncbi:unnamed protein product [Sphenostylis stenocarpa]|uniref:Uncharacterized protein n=1 Tax=Sphenostylis stenocarpa TaxID=92480 RepID=A0AA86TC34_9FABA|nr:unnamed protein product [Sphenostylis stenocarpa]